MSRRVLFAIDSLNSGGAERSTLEIGKRFTRFRPLVFALQPGGALSDGFRDAQLEIVAPERRGRRHILSQTSWVNDLVRSRGIELVHSSLFWSELVTRLGRLRNQVPLVGSFVNESYSPVRYSLERGPVRVKLRCYQLFDSVTAKAADHFVAISHQAKRSNCDALHVPDDKVTVIPRGRDPKTFEDIDPERVAAVSEELRQSAGGPVILNVARLLERKGQLELVRAMASVVAEWPSARLALAGDGPFRNRLEDEVRDLGLGDSVRFLGTRSDVPYLLAATDVFAFPSHYEGHGGALVEAMFAGCPIVAADTPVHRESVEHDESALMFPRGDHQGLAAALIRMLDHRSQAERMGTRARSVAHDRFHIDRVAQKHEELYEKIIDDRRHADEDRSAD